MAEIYFVSGIDTDAGKSYATGFLARSMREAGLNVITQKFVQTGVGQDYEVISEDILTHRRIMGIDPLPEDRDHTTCPQRFSYPASPDLAARLEGREVDLEIIDLSTQKLAAHYELVLVEGAGGLMVPLTGSYTTFDYIRERNYPLILVSNPKLGSVNHTLLSLEVCMSRGVTVDTLVYNHYPVTSDTITDDTRAALKAYLSEKLPLCKFIEVPYIKL